MKKLIAIALSSLILVGCTIQPVVNPEFDPISDNGKATLQDESKEDDSESVQIPEQLPVDNDGGIFSKNDIIYFVMTDRFYDASASSNLEDTDPTSPTKFQGGDLQGITEKLDYIASLGATAIWLTPVMTNGQDGYHGYWIHDFYSVDPHLGSMDDFKRLVDEAHNRDIKVILDYIVNHTGYDSPWINDPQKASWFHEHKDITNWSDPVLIENGWLAGLPDLDQSNPEVESYFIENAKWWISETGIDGFRLDTVRHVPKDFWRAFSAGIKEDYPDFFLLGEVWSDNARYIELYHKEGIDGNTNYSLYAGITAAFSPLSDVRTLINAIQKDTNFERPDLNGIFIDNHDNPRFVSVSKENGEAYLKQAMTLMYSYPAIPVLYYGTEIAMEGGADPDNRRMMAWDEVEGSQMLAFTKQLVELRSKYMGELTVIDYDVKHLVYTSKGPDGTMLVVLNTEKKEKTITFDYDHNTSQALLQDTPAAIISSGTWQIQMPELGIAVYKVED
ncbi:MULTISPECIES: alpha-amylase family glycosyl hydrolase [unclassified Fusibacter]|uniref:alpha-amylase family glycosyl hydrolase n=1 Tax=unclassified Fusibacter TaxID=2624464 RepID=UPI0013E93348|nr:MULTISPECIES: alpha-amylase family glycosyl hydrolase [unclassified Fusibacter]MCK8059049.1 alpha-amylase family glycosyl hydrolase [Fusibacter sp. A2]NPE22460.1 alpha-amylase [Fusibacter sp. A1]